MKLANEFTIDALAHQVWGTMLDFERVAGCVPGSQVIGPAHDGGLEADIRIKVGPMAMTYRGVVNIVERDETSRRAVMEAKARESRGQGTATASMVMQVHDGSPVTVSIATDLDVTGRVAQMGRGVMQDVAGRIVADFARNLQGMVAGEGETAASAAANAGPAQPLRADGAPEAPTLAAPAPEAALSGRRLAVAVVQGRLRAVRDWIRARLRGRR